MILGVLSDTHGNVAATLAAVRVLSDLGAAHFVHCGDVGSDDVLDVLAGVPSCFVFGNNDYDREEMRRYAESIGIQCLGDGGTLEIDGKRVAVTHGDDGRMIARLCSPENHADYLLTGHSHRKHDQRVGAVRCINPGALYRAAVKTVATIDLATGEVAWVEVPGV